MNSNRSRSVELAASLLCLVLTVTILYFIQSVVVPLLFAILIAISLYPIARRLENWRLPKVISAVISVIIAIVLIAGIIYLVINQAIIIGHTDFDLHDKFITIVDTIQGWITSTFGVEPGEMWQRVKDQSSAILSKTTAYATRAFGSAGSILASIVLVPLYVFFLLYYRDFFREFFFRVFISTPKEKIQATLDKIYSVVQSYLLGLITVMGIVAILNTIGLLVLGIQYAWFFGILAALLMLIPYIGIAIGSVLPALFAIATKDSAWYALGVIVWFQVVQFLESNFITPNIVGGRVSINPLMAIISLLLGGLLFGLGGFILAIPYAAVLKVILEDNPSTSAYGFLIGEPKEYHLKRFSSKIVFKRWKLKDKLPKKKKS